MVKREKERRKECKKEKKEGRKEGRSIGNVLIKGECEHHHFLADPGRSPHHKGCEV